jgi:hypothetical protein
VGSLILKGAGVFAFFYGFFIWQLGVGIASIIMGGFIVFILIPGGFAGFIPNPFKSKKKDKTADQ